MSTAQLYAGLRNQWSIIFLFKLFEIRCTG